MKRVALFILASLCLSLPAHAAEAETSDVIVWKGDKQLQGTIESASLSEGELQLAHPLARGPVPVSLDEATRLVFSSSAAEAQPDASPGIQVFLFSNGNRLLGRLLELKGDRVQLDCPGIGPITASRQALRSLQPHPPAPEEPDGGETTKWTVAPTESHPGTNATFQSSRSNRLPPHTRVRRFTRTPQSLFAAGFNLNTATLEGHDGPLLTIEIGRQSGHLSVAFGVADENALRATLALTDKTTGKKTPLAATTWPVSADPRRIAGHVGFDAAAGRVVATINNSTTLVAEVPPDGNAEWVAIASGKALINVSPALRPVARSPVKDAPVRDADVVSLFHSGQAVGHIEKIADQIVSLQVGGSILEIPLSTVSGIQFKPGTEKLKGVLCELAGEQYLTLSDVVLKEDRFVGLHGGMALDLPRAMLRSIHLLEDTRKSAPAARRHIHGRPPINAQLRQNIQFAPMEQQVLFDPGVVINGREVW